MAFNEKLITPDIVEILDVKIFTKSAHPQIFVLAGEPYDTVLDKLQLQVLTPGQKAAIDATASVPSALNPVVLELDIPIYYPPQDLGEIKDAVNTFADLPLVVTPTGDTTLGSTTILNVSSMVYVVPGQLVSGVGIPANSYVVSVGISTFDINLPATATAAGVILTLSPELSDVRPVLTLNMLYRWDGFTWNPFMSTGTLDHTMLINQDLDPNYQHITLAQKTAAISLTHIHGFYFDPTDVGVVANTITRTAHTLLNDTPVEVSSAGTLPGGLISATTYYVVSATANTFKLSTTIGGGAIDITSQGTNGPSSNSHVLSKVPQLELITSAGSGIIISNAERQRLPSANEKDALLGTQGTPSITNRYVTNADPRLNTARNPYATVGPQLPFQPPPSYPGTEVGAFIDALEGLSSFVCTISVGIPAVVTTNHNFEDGDIVFFRNYTVGTTGVTTNGSPIITDVSSFHGIVVGHSITGPGIPAGSTVLAIGATTLTISNPATISSNPITLINPAVPLTLSSILPTGIAEETVYYVRNSVPTFFNVSLLPLGPVVNTSGTSSGRILVGGNNQFLKALEVLPVIYTMHSAFNFSNLRWDLQEDSLLIESIDPQGATLNWRTLKDAIEVLPPGVGPVTIRGFKFTLDGLNTRGVLFQRDNCIIEDCVFTGLTSNAELHKGVTVDADYVHISRCVFDGYLVSGIDVKGNNCRIEDCKFLLDSSASYAVDIYPGLENTKIYTSKFDNCTLRIQAGCLNTQLDDNQLGPVVTFIDAGINTRFINGPGNDIQNYGQAYTGKTKTIGPLGSMADYRGNTEAIFIAALADPYVEELLVLEALPFYNFTASVTIPPGKALKGVSKNFDVSFFSGVSNLTPFILSDRSVLENVYVQSTDAPCVYIPPGTSSAAVLNCALYVQTADSVDDFGVYMDTTTDCRVENCHIIGINGIRMLGCTGAKIYSNSISPTSQAIEMDALCDVCHIKDNHFLFGNMDFAGTRLIIEGNHFIPGAPNKLLTSDSVWENNWPHPTANNFYGVDYRTLSLAKYLESRSPGCSKVSILDVGGLSYLKTGDGHGITLPITLDFKIDKTSGFDVVLHWTSNAAAGSVRWRATIVFRDSALMQLGTPLIQYGTSPRTNLALQEEETITLTFPAVYGLITDPTHVSIEISRLPFDVGDTLPTDAVLTAAEIKLRREL